MVSFDILQTTLNVSMFEIALGFFRFIVVILAIVMPMVLLVLMAKSINKRKKKSVFICVISLVLSIVFAYIVFTDIKLPARVDIESIKTYHETLLSTESGYYEFDTGYIDGSMRVSDLNDDYTPVLDYATDYKKYKSHEIDEYTKCYISPVICYKDDRLSHLWEPLGSYGTIVIESKDKLIEIKYNYINSGVADILWPISNPQTFYRPEIDFGDLVTTLGFENKLSTTKMRYTNEISDFGVDFKVEDGALYLKGENIDYFFEDASSLNPNQWNKLTFKEKIIHISACGGTLLYLTDEGDVYGLGNTEGIFSEYDPNNPIQYITTPEILFEDCKYVSVGSKFAIFLKNDNTLWFLGESKNGQSTKIADRIGEPLKIADNVYFAEAFGYTCGWIDEHQQLHLCGDNSYGQIGNGKKGNGYPTTYESIVTTPYIALRNCANFTSADGESVIALRTDGTKYAWGGEYGPAPKNIG
ncbi:MAG: hypothetical protein J6D06_09225 [Clostridia bacterium]|nr:hypothetical protein [Clostridia bacterium]